MAYLKKIKSLIGAKKVLRLLTNKLRFHKLQTSKTTRRKIKKRTTTTTKGGGSSCLSLSFQSRFKRKRKEVYKYPWKKTKPVYVDQLFLEKAPEVQGNIPVVERIGGSTTVSGKVADEMWESLVMGSPQMDGINERAEEFISRFRADLLDQEITARRL